MTHSTILFLLGWASIQGASSAQQLFDAPATYFGGTDHESYLQWIQEATIMEEYPSSTFLPGKSGNPTEGVALHWRIEDDTLHVAVAARIGTSVGASEGGLTAEQINRPDASPPTGWLAWGLSPAGGMLGADVVYWQASQPNVLTDAHIIEDRAKPITDACNGQDWTLRQADTNRTGFVMWQGYRPLQTGDSQDHDILAVQDLPGVPGHRVIAAWGDGPDIGYHGDRVARGAVHFGAATRVDFAAQMNQQATASFVVRATSHTLRPVDTDYVDFCVSKADILAQGVPGDVPLQVIGFEPILTPGNEKYVHHFVVTASSDSRVDACDRARNFFELAYVWAPGEQPFALPEFLGGPLFGSSFSAFNIQIHYNNPDEHTGVVDSSGVRFYVSDHLREQELGILQIGDPFIQLSGQPVGRGLSRHSLTCPGTCSVLALDEPVTVLREFLHMHQSGTRITNEQIRDGETIHEGAIDVWEYDQQSNALVTQRPFEIHPGDSFRTTCYYRDAEGSTEFGLSSQEEMCIAFLAYYPRKLIAGRFPWFCATGIEDFAPCNAVYDHQLLDSDVALGRKFMHCTDLNDSVPSASPPHRGRTATALAMIIMTMVTKTF